MKPSESFVARASLDPWKFSSLSKKQKNEDQWYDRYSR